MRRRQTDRQQGRIRQDAKGHAEGAVDQLRAEPDGEEQPPVIHGRLPRAGRPAYHALHLLRPMRPFAAIGQPEITQRSEGRAVAKEKCHARKRASPFGIEKACHFAAKASDETRRAQIATAAGFLGDLWIGNGLDLAAGGTFLPLTWGQTKTMRRLLL